MATDSPSPLGFNVRLPLPSDEAIARVTEALKAEGFGILTRIDVQATLKEKI
ncbi:MAG TPA: ABC transporter, partial [Anaerolineae bacterium]|nr:ABC transporter [Anaerolineae bacterium]